MLNLFYTVEHLSYLSQVIAIWILEYPYRPFLSAHYVIYKPVRIYHTSKTLIKQIVRGRTL